MGPKATGKWTRTVRASTALTRGSTGIGTAAELKKLPSTGWTQHWAVMVGNEQIGQIDKNRTTSRGRTPSTEPYHAMVLPAPSPPTPGKRMKGLKHVGSFYDTKDLEKGIEIGEGELRKLRSEGRLGDGLALALKAVEKASR